MLVNDDGWVTGFARAGEAETSYHFVGPQVAAHAAFDQHRQVIRSDIRSHAAVLDEKLVAHKTVIDGNLQHGAAGGPGGVDAEAAPAVAQAGDAEALVKTGGPGRGVEVSEQHARSAGVRGEFGQLAQLLVADVGAAAARGIGVCGDDGEGLSVLLQPGDDGDVAAR